MLLSSGSSRRSDAGASMTRNPSRSRADEIASDVRRDVKVGRTNSTVLALDDDPPLETGFCCHVRLSPSRRCRASPYGGLPVYRRVLQSRSDAPVETG